MENWIERKIGELLSESKIESFNPDTNNRLRVKLNLGGVEKRPDTTDKEGATKYFKRKAGQFIYGKQNLHKGAFGIIPLELDGFESSSDIPAFDVHELCYPEWIFYYFKQGNFYLKLESLAKGVGSKRIQPGQLFNLKVLLPSLEEQRRILDEVESFEERYSKVRKEIENQRDLVHKLKKSFIHEAVGGKLTGKWREDNIASPNAKILLKEVKLEKARLITEKKIPKEGPSKPIINSEIPYEIPENWSWARLVDVIRFMAYGTSQKTNDNFDDIPVLRMGNITSDGKLIFDNLKYIPPQHRDLPKLYLNDGDIVFNRTNSYELVGKSAVYMGEENKYTLASYLIKVSLFKEYINPEYINYYIISPLCRKTQIEPQIIVQTNQANFSGSKLKNILVPIPPLSEQNEIVEKTKNLQTYCSNLEQKIAQNLNDVNSLITSTLKDTFRVDNSQIERLKIDNNKVVEQGKSIKKINYQRNDSIMELIEILKQNGKMPAVDLWKMSKHENDIDSFYDDLKQQIQVNKTIKESNEKGFLELTNEN